MIRLFVALFRRRKRYLGRRAWVAQIAATTASTRRSEWR